MDFLFLQPNLFVFDFPDMIFAFDTYYYGNKAKTVALAFNSWYSSQALEIYSEILEGVAEYTPGEFYKRELPCILSLLKQIEPSLIDLIIVDSFVFLDDQEALGLGGHLYHALDGAVPVIGVAKTNFATIDRKKAQVFRGESKLPLYITAIGMDLPEAAENIRSMHGTFRMPTLLKRLDDFTKDVIS